MIWESAQKEKLLIVTQIRMVGTSQAIADGRHRKSKRKIGANYPKLIKLHNLSALQLADRNDRKSSRTVFVSQQGLFGGPFFLGLTMSTFLELVQSLRQEAGVSGSGPSTVISQTGMLKKLVDWTSRAWNQIQNSRPDWLWMVKEFTFNTTSGSGNYTAAGVSITDFGEWERDSFRIYLTSAGVADERELAWVDYDDWRSIYATGTQVDDYPIYFTIKPDKSIQLAPIPNDIFTVRGDYRQSAQSLSANTDEPGLPSRFHDLILFRALMYYGANEGAPDIYVSAKEDYRILRNSLILDQTQPMGRTEPLA
jgi:hypothetical protein